VYAYVMNNPLSHRDRLGLDDDPSDSSNTSSDVDSPDINISDPSSGSNGQGTGFWQGLADILNNKSGQTAEAAYENYLDTGDTTSLDMAGGYATVSDYNQTMLQGTVYAYQFSAAGGGLLMSGTGFGMSLAAIAQATTYGESLFGVSGLISSGYGAWENIYTMTGGTPPATLSYPMATFGIGLDVIQPGPELSYDLMNLSTKLLLGQ